jgi:misacylated tRNA(Ala) deacylase
LVEKIYLNDSYAKETDAKVTSISNKNEKEIEIELDKTVFYPGGGGELPDTGIISFNGQENKVINTKKNGDNVIHIIEALPNFKVNDEVHCKIDWKKRYAYMRHHTAIHVISGIMESKYNAMFTGGMISDMKSHFDFDMPELNRELAEQVIKESQLVINRNLNVVVKILSKEEALKIPNLVRTEPGRELLNKLETVRVVDIENFDVQMDGGTHVKNTKEIGIVNLSGFENKGSHRKRVEISLNDL